MNYVIDACSLINLDNADALHVVTGLGRCRLWVSPMVLGECSVSCAAKVVELQNLGLMGRIDDEIIPVDVYLNLLAIHGLGDGETECIAAAQQLGYCICSDDKQARSLSSRMFGENRIVGTARLLRWCVEDAVIVCGDAERHFQGMRDAGGFLPALDRGFFCVGAC